MCINIVKFWPIRAYKLNVECDHDQRVTMAKKVLPVIVGRIFASEVSLKS